MSAKIEFERAEYQGEIDQLQEEIAAKDENTKVKYIIMDQAYFGNSVDKICEE